MLRCLYNFLHATSTRHVLILHDMTQIVTNKVANTKYVLYQRGW